MIAVEGSLQSRNYEDKTGAKRTAYEVVVDQAYFADSRQSASGGNTFAEPSYGGNGGMQQAAPRFEEPQRGQNLSVGNLGGFESLDTDDGDLPF